MGGVLPLHTVSRRNGRSRNRLEPTGPLAGETAATGKHKVWSWHIVKCQQRFSMYRHFLSTSVSDGRRAMSTAHMPTPRQSLAPWESRYSPGGVALEKPSEKLHRRPSSEAAKHGGFPFLHAQVGSCPPAWGRLFLLSMPAMCTASPGRGTLLDQSQRLHNLTDLRPLGLGRFDQRRPEGADVKPGEGERGLNRDGVGGYEDGLEQRQ